MAKKHSSPVDSFDWMHKKSNSEIEEYACEWMRSHYDCLLLVNKDRITRATIRQQESSHHPQRGNGSTGSFSSQHDACSHRCTKQSPESTQHQSLYWRSWSQLFIIHTHSIIRVDQNPSISYSQTHSPPSCIPPYSTGFLHSMHHHLNLHALMVTVSFDVLPTSCLT